MDFIWYPAYRDAILETEQPEMRERLLFAEQKMIERLRVLSRDHGGTDEERQAIAAALYVIKNLRAEIVGWKHTDVA